MNDDISTYILMLDITYMYWMKNSYLCSTESVGFVQ